MLARVGIDDVRVRVAEGGQHHASRGVDDCVGILLFKLQHGAKGGKLVVFDNEVGILDGFHLCHILATDAEPGLAFHLHQLLDILN